MFQKLVKLHIRIQHRLARKKATLNGASAGSKENNVEQPIEQYT